MPKQNLRRYLRKIYVLIAVMGIDLVKIFRAITGFGFYINDFFKIKSQKNSNKDFIFGFPLPILDEKFAEGGVMSGHYFHQDLLIAQKVYKNNPHKHIDIGSRVDGFAAHVAVFREIEVFDVRPIKSKVKNIIFRQADLMNLDPKMINYCDSISSLHAIEHFGLGRYGDPIDYDGHKKALNNIYKILKKGGKFYFSTPIGKQRIEFNAHRVFDVKYLLNLFKNKYEIESFSYVNDEGGLFENVKLNESDIRNNFGCYFGCGIFEMRKI
mgnify:CR=1 FL=1